MMYINDQDKENIHPNILNNPNKKVQFSDKLKRYHNDTLTFSSDNSPQVTESKQNHPQKIFMHNQSTSEQSLHPNHQPEVSHFDIEELHNLSKQISIKNASKIFSKRENLEKNKIKQNWIKSIMEPSNAERKLLEKIENMLEKQSFKPIYSTISRIRKECNSNNTMTTEEKLLSENLSKFKLSVDNSKSSSPESNNKSSLSDLINFSRLSGLSSKTLEKYLLCLEKEKLNELEKSHKVSEFSLIDTERSKEVKLDHSSQKSKENQLEKIENEKKLIIEIYLLIKDQITNELNSNEINTNKMLTEIKSYVVKTLSNHNKTLIKQEDSTCLLED